MWVEAKDKGIVCIITDIKINYMNMTSIFIKPWTHLVIIWTKESVGQRYFYYLRGDS